MYFGIKGFTDSLFGGVFFMAVLLFILRQAGIFGEPYASAFDITVAKVLYAHPITLNALSRPENYGYSTPCLEKEVLGDGVWGEVHNFVCQGGMKDRKWAQ